VTLTPVFQKIAAPEEIVKDKNKRVNEEGDREEREKFQKINLE
jgi:hypothetical protein